MKYFDAWNVFLAILEPLWAASSDQDRFRSDVVAYVERSGPHWSVLEASQNDLGPSWSVLEAPWRLRLAFLMGPRRILHASVAVLGGLGSAMLAKMSQ